ncbi:hypothetical protein ACLB2K_068569 [Fragaria x ananassa]
MVIQSKLTCCFGHASQQGQSRNSGDSKVKRKRFARRDTARTRNENDFKNLQSLEICGGELTDASVKNLKDLVCLTWLNLSQNRSLTDKSLEVIFGLTALVSSNISNSRITDEGLHYLKPSKNLRSLTLEYSMVTASEIRKQPP